MSDGVVIALIGAVSSVVGLLATGVVSIVLVLVKRRVATVQADAAASRVQLENDHGNAPGKIPNLRENLDRNHEEARRWNRVFNQRLDAMEGLISTTIQRVDRHEQLVDEITGPLPGKGKHKA